MAVFISDHFNEENMLVMEFSKNRMERFIQESLLMEYLTERVRKSIIPGSFTAVLGFVEQRKVSVL